MCCDRSTTFVALNVAAPHFESVWNCEPVRLLMTQYTKKIMDTYTRTQSYQVERIMRHQMSTQRIMWRKKNRVWNDQVAIFLWMCTSNTSEAHAIRKMAIGEANCRNEYRTTLVRETIWESNRRESFQRNVTSHFELCGAIFRPSNFEYACH